MNQRLLGRRPHSTHLIALLALSSCYSDPKTGPDTGIAPTSPSPDRFTAAAVGVGTNCAAPPPRRYHQMAYFLDPKGLEIGSGVVTERGFLLYGGISEAGLPLDDAWIFDLSRHGAPGVTCPWVQLSSNVLPASHGISHGTLAYLPGEEKDDGTYRRGEFHVLGGLDWNSAADAEPSQTQHVLRPGAALQTVSLGAPALETVAVFEEVGAATCHKEIWDCMCLGPGPCDDGTSSYNEGDLMGQYRAGTIGNWDSTRRAVCEQLQESGPENGDDWHHHFGSTSCSISNFGTGCLPDPFCAGEAPDPEVLDLVAAVHDHTSPGRLDAGWAWFPSSAQLWVHGGSVGCVGLLCDVTPFADILALSQASDPDALHLGNDPTARILTVRPNTAANWLGNSPAEDQPWEWDGFPSYTTTGVRGAAGAPVGVDWLFPSKAPVQVGAERAVFWGGTTAQATAPSREHHVDDGAQSSDWVDVYEIEGFTASQKRLQDSWKFRRLNNDGSWSALSGSNNEGIYDASLTELGPTVLVAQGGLGFDANGADTIHVLASDDAAGADHVFQQFSGPQFQGYGARGVHDPVESSVWLFGAFQGAHDLVRVQDTLDGLLRYDVLDDPDVDRLEVELTQLEYGLEHLGPGTSPLDEAWRLTAASRVRMSGHTVASGDEYTQRIAVSVPAVLGMHWDDAVEAIHATVAGVGDHDLPMELIPIKSAATLELDVVRAPQITFFSPLTLFEGVEYEVVVEATVVPPRSAANPDVEAGDNLVLYDGNSPYAAVAAGVNTTCEASELLGWEGVWNVPVQDVGTLPDVKARYQLPTGWAPVVPGEAFTCGSGLELLAPVAGGTCLQFQPGDQMARFLVQHHGVVHSHAQKLATFTVHPPDDFREVCDEQGQHTEAVTGVQRTVDVWVDTCLEADTQGLVGQLVTHDAQPKAQLLADLYGANLVDQAWPRALVFFRRPDEGIPGDESALTSGYATAGMVHVVPFTLPEDAVSNLALVTDLDAEGTEEEQLVASQRAGLGSIFVHELAHALNPKFDDYWFDESVATVGQLLAYPNAQGDVLFDGLYWRVHAWVEDRTSDELLRDFTVPVPEAPSDDAVAAAIARNYASGPYLLMQAAEARPGGAPALFELYGQTLLEHLSCNPEADPATRYASALGSVWSERMTGTLVGEPLLGITAIDPVAGTFEVEQVQVGRLLAGGDVYRPFAVFTDVPFAIGCMQADPVTGEWTLGPSGRSGCDGHLELDAATSELEPVFGSSRQLTSAQTTTVGDGSGWPTAPAEPHFVYGLFANDLLLDEATGQYAVGTGLTTAPPSYLTDPRPVTWRPYCADGDTAAFCTGDFDGDGVVDDLDIDADGNTDGFPDDRDGDGARRPYDCYDQPIPAHADAYPLAVEPVVDWPPAYGSGLTVKDHNCDGWPVDWTQRPGGN